MRLRCGFSAKGTLAAEERRQGEDREGQGAQADPGKEVLHRQEDQLVNVKVKMSKSARKALKGKKRLKAEALLRARRDGTSSAMRKNKTKLTLRVSRK